QCAPVGWLSSNRSASNVRRPQLPSDQCFTHTSRDGSDAVPGIAEEEHHCTGLSVFERRAALFESRRADLQIELAAFVAVIEKQREAHFADQAFEPVRMRMLIDMPIVLAADAIARMLKMLGMRQREIPIVGFVDVGHDRIEEV